MKRCIPVLLVLAACRKSEPPSPSTSASSLASSPPVVRAVRIPPGGPFEGEILVNVKADPSEKLPSSIMYDVKGPKVRVAPAAATTHASGNTITLYAYVLDDAKKLYQEIDVRPPADKTKAVEARLTKTGRMEKVAGVECEDWTIEDGSEKADACVAKDIDFLDLAREPRPGSGEPAWAATLTKEKSFPLRVVVHDKAGKEHYRAEAARVDRKRLDDTMFDVPIDYKKGELREQVRTVSLP